MSFDGNIKDLNRMIESYIKNETKRKELEEQEQDKNVKLSATVIDKS